jgi:CheY-like chemotaxis protein
LSRDARGPAPQILVVEDELLIAMEIESLLRRGGFRGIGPALTVAGALALIQRQRPDAAVLDVNLRGERVTPVADVPGACEPPSCLRAPINAPICAATMSSPAH